MSVVDICALGSLYAGEKPEYLEECISSLRRQTLKVPIFLVIDGPITPELEAVLERNRDVFAAIWCFSENRGLAAGLNAGLEKISDPIKYVIRYDTDDINEDNRFELLSRAIRERNLTLLGSSMLEVDDDLNVLGKRKCPSDPNTISRQIVRRNPFSHPSVVFKLEDVKEVGGYSELKFFEDWYLWAKLERNGCGLGNLETVLVKFRANHGMVGRRRGSKYAKLELKFFSKLIKLYPLRTLEIVFFALLRASLRLLPANHFKTVFLCDQKETWLTILSNPGLGAATSF